MPVSVIMAIRSALAQECGVQIVVVDDCSSPALQLPKDLARLTNLTLLKHKKNRGASAARNSGIAGSTTPWIAMLDADDVFVENTLHERLNFAQAYLETNGQTIFSCSWQELLADGSTRCFRTPRPANRAEEFASGCWWNPGSTTLARRDVYKTGSLYLEGMPRLEDLEWGLRFGINGGALVVQNIIGAIVKPSLTAGLGAVSISSEIIRTKHKELANSNPKVWKRLNAYLELELAAVNFKSGNRRLAIKHLIRSMWLKPRIRLSLSPGWDFKKP